MTTAQAVDRIPPLTHDEAMTLAATEFDRMIDLLRALTPDDWARPTVCPLWDVRALVAHVVGMGEAQASVRQFAHDFRAATKRDGGPKIDAFTATQVRERAGVAPAELIKRLADAAPRAVRARRRAPALIRKTVRLRQDPPFETERWTLGYLFDVVFTRDVWMHRLDVSRATGRPMALTADHDGRIVVDVVAEWARRHGRPCTLTLLGPAGGSWRAGHGSGDPGASIDVDALEFCWTLAGRMPGEGLMAIPVPF